MELWICSMYDCSNMKTTILGVYSTRAGAESEARMWIMGIGVNVETIDRSVNPEMETIYYKAWIPWDDDKYSIQYYTATIEKFKLDEESF